MIDLVKTEFDGPASCGVNARDPHVSSVAVDNLPRAALNRSYHKRGESSSRAAFETPFSRRVTDRTLREVRSRSVDLSSSTAARTSTAPPLGPGDARAHARPGPLLNFERGAAGTVLSPVAVRPARSPSKRTRRPGGQGMTDHRQGAVGDPAAVLSSRITLQNFQLRRVAPGMDAPKGSVRWLTIRSIWNGLRTLQVAIRKAFTGRSIRWPSSFRTWASFNPTRG